MSVQEAAIYSWVLIAPMVIVVLVAAVVPWALSKWLPQTMWGLALNLVLSGVIMMVASAGLLAGLYLAQGVPKEAILFALPHLGKLGLQAGLIWLPIVLLRLAMQPQHWRPDL